MPNGDDHGIGEHNGILVTDLFMNWLITGGCGFIGRAITAHLLKHSTDHVRVLDNLSVGTRKELSQIGEVFDLDADHHADDWSMRLSLLEGDILNAQSVMAAVTGADIVIHLAANTGVGPSVEDPMSDCRTNVLGTLNLLESARASHVGRFVFASSGAPLGAQTPPLHEEMAPHPASPYGASKLAGEGYCSAYFHCFGLETVVLRFGNVYGEGSGHKQSVVAKFIKQALAGEDLEIFGDGSQTRDFIHISDLVAAIAKAGRVSGVGGETFQIATATETTVSEMTDTLTAVMAQGGVAPPTVFHGETRDGDVQRNYSDTSKAEDRLGWRSEVGLADGLRRTLQHFLPTHKNSKQR